MREESVARRYAAAFFNQARAKDKVKETAADLQAIADVLAKHPKLATLMGHPLVTELRKKEVIQAAFGKAGLQPMTLAFLNLLVDKRRIGLLDDIKAEFNRLLRAFHRIASATAISAVPLTKTQVTALEKALEARTGKDIELTTAVDPSLMGGILVRIGDTVLDGTVKGNLERLREQLLTRKN